MSQPASEARQQPVPASDIAVRVAWLYYVEELTQEEIVRALNLSRGKVIRLLAAARKSGLVQIRIEGRAGEQVALERALAHQFGLSEVVVVPAPASDAAVGALVGQAAGTYLADHVHDGMSIGVGWGATLSMSLKAIGAQPFERLSIVSLMGGMTHSRSINPSAVARRIADAFGAECYQLTAPLFVADEATRTALWAEPALKDLLEHARKVDLALVSVGDVSKDATLFREGLLPSSQVASLIKHGAFGDVLCQFLNADGCIIDHPLSKRVIAVGLEDLRRVPNVVLAAGGVRKVAAIRAALKAMQPKVLITDEAAARGLLGMKRPRA